jgi:hypothetical protein
VTIKTAIVILASLFSWSAGAAPPADCMARLREAVRGGDFSDPFICSRKDAKFEFVGRTSGQRVFDLQP